MSDVVLNLFLSFFPLCGSLIHIYLVFHLVKLTNQPPGSLADYSLFIAISFFPYAVLYFPSLFVKKYGLKLLAITIFVCMIFFDLYAYFGQVSQQSRAWLNIIVPVFFLTPAAFISVIIINLIDNRKS